jgi:hypothetical protein
MLALMLLVTLMWGSWFQVIKHIKDFPISAFMSWLYFFSVIIVWGLIAVFGSRLVPDTIIAEVANYPAKAVLVFVCGIIFAAGMQLQLIVVRHIGLILSTSVSATCSILSGTMLSAVLGGLSQKASLFVIALSSLMLIIATIVCQVSGVFRDRDKLQIKELHSHKPSGRAKDIAILVFVNTVLLSSYTIAVSAGLKSDLRPEGFSSFTNMGILVLGAFSGSVIFSVFFLSKTRQLHRFLDPLKNKKLLLFLLIAAICHFGGNVLQSLVAPFIGVAIAIPMGYSYHMWSYFWGLVYGEYRGASRKTYGVLMLGIAFFILGIVLLSINV